MICHMLIPYKTNCANGIISVQIKFFLNVCFQNKVNFVKMLIKSNCFVLSLDFQEHIECNLEDHEGEICSPAPMVSLLDRASQNTMVRTSQTDLRAIDRRGLLWLLDEEAVFPNASDEGFLERLLTHYGDRGTNETCIVFSINCNYDLNSLSVFKLKQGFLLHYVSNKIVIPFNMLYA